MRAIVCEHLYFSYDTTPILNDVSFEIAEGDYVGIFGPNGGGKTTLLKLLLGFLKPNQGEIKIFGKSPEQARSSIAYVPQKLKFDPLFPVSVLEVVLMGLYSQLNFLGQLPKGSKEAALKALAQVNMEAFANRSFGTLSGGEAQRVLIARAIVTEPKLLLLDEPTASVDTAAEKEIYRILKSLKNKMTILMVTHHLQTASDEVQNALCVQRDVQFLTKEQLCGHFAIGLYHPPLKTP